VTDHEEVTRMGTTHESLRHERVVLATLVASAAKGARWQELTLLCEAVAGVRGLRAARATTLHGLAELLADGRAACRVAPALGGPRAEFGVRAARPEPPVEGEGEVRYLGDGRWAARRGDREITGIVGLEEATETAVELMREAA
jgi:hypothetical protein